MGEPLIFAPKAYWELTKEEKKKICNGCGPQGWKFDIIPDTMWFLDISEACNAHDFMYHVARPTVKDKDEADRVFLNNLTRIIDAKTKKRIKFFWGSFVNPIYKMRLHRAKLYYKFVRDHGGPAFWTGKNDSGTIHYIDSYKEVVVK